MPDNVPMMLKETIKTIDRIDRNLFIFYNCILPLFDEICNWLNTDEAEKLCQELAVIA